MRILVKGAGVAGLTLARELARRGADVTLVERRETLAGSASWIAGGMLAPWCERESAEGDVLSLGQSAAGWWEAALPGHVVRNGTLVVAPPRDIAELDRFAARTGGYRPLVDTDIAALEPDLAGRFRRGLFFADEAHLDPRRALTALAAELTAKGTRFELGYGAVLRYRAFDIEADCTGVAAALPGLRGVRGEMLLVKSRDIRLSRPVRLLHPRWPIYLVPRENGLFMLGATMLESASIAPIAARSAMELLNAAYALHPAFAEAEIIEAGVGVRPAFADNLPRVTFDGRRLSINGLYRHGFLLAPAMARRAADLVQANHPEMAA